MNLPQKKIYSLTFADLRKLFLYFEQHSIQNIGPVVREGVIMLDTLTTLDDLPSGYSEVLGKGSYRLSKNDSEGLFNYTLGPQSFKRFLNPPRRKLWTAEKNGENFDIHPHVDKHQEMVFWGIRSCDLNALEILDKVFIDGNFPNVTYQKNRQSMWVVAVNCLYPSSNCFCHSMGIGPMNSDGFDFALTEIFFRGRHEFLCEIGSERALDLILELRFPLAEQPKIDHAYACIEKATNSMSRSLDMEGVATQLKDTLEHQEWDKVAERCLSCANCTMVCPTCFCSTTEDVTDITGDHTERWLRWDSCFNSEFSFIHGGVIRNSTKSRYRQWLTHKMSSWYDQYGSSGCVGCGRCITWCPVGIDLVDEIEILKNHKMDLNESS